MSKPSLPNTGDSVPTRNDLPTARSGHWALQAYLYFYGFVALALLLAEPCIAGPFHTKYPHAPSWCFPFGVASLFANLISFIGLWNYQRWAHYLTIVLLTSGGIQGASLESDPRPLFRAWIAYCILWFLLKLGGPSNSAMSKLR